MNNLKFVAIFWFGNSLQVSSVSEIPEGMEVLDWGGIDSGTQYRCRHGKHPRRLLYWDGRNTGRRYLGCPMVVCNCFYIVALF